MLKKGLCFALSILMAGLMMSGCGQDVNKALDDAYNSFSSQLNDFQSSKGDYPESVLDALNMMLDNYVSGLSRPPAGSISSSSVPSGNSSAQTIIQNTSEVVNNEAELENLLYESIKNIDADVSFEVNGSWCTSDTLYETIYYKIHDVYMIDAYGLDCYSYMVTTNNGNDVYKVEFSYLDGMDSATISDMRDDIESKAKDIIRSLNLGSKSDYEKIYAINKYLCDNVYYPQEPFITQDFTPYGALIDGRAVCDGYARATKILADMSGLDIYYVPGYCGDPVTGGHAWNLVKVDNEYYQLDVTWNDSGATDDYFLVTDDFMSLSREWDKSAFPASAKKSYS